jgi:hypothetical protein
LKTVGSAADIVTGDADASVRVAGWAIEADPVEVTLIVVHEIVRVPSLNAASGAPAAVVVL